MLRSKKRVICVQCTTLIPADLDEPHTHILHIFFTFLNFGIISFSFHASAILSYFLSFSHGHWIPIFLKEKCCKCYDMRFPKLSAFTSQLFTDNCHIFPIHRLLKGRLWQLGNHSCSMTLENEKLPQSFR